MLAFDNLHRIFIEESRCLGGNAAFFQSVWILAFLTNFYIVPTTPAAMFDLINFTNFFGPNPFTCRPITIQ